MIGRICRVSLAVLLAMLIVLAPVVPASAQQQGQSGGALPAQPEPQTRMIQVSTRDYSLGNRWIPNPFAPYKPISVQEPVLANSAHIEQMIKDGKLQVSLEEAVDLALENNLDIQIQRYAPWIAEANILYTLGGGINRGSFTPYGVVPVENFDPLITANLSLDQRTIPVNNPITAGTGGAAAVGTFSSLATHTAIGDVSYSQGFHTGTSFSAYFNNTRISTTSANNFFNPSVQSNFVLVASQQLLSGFGLDANEHYIRLAKLNKNMADEAFAQQVITSITAVANAYWELVFARGNVDVALHEVELANKLYSDNKKQVDVGTLAPLEIVQAEAQVATAQQTLIVDQTTLLQNQLTLLNLIAKDPTAPLLRNLEIIPTDTADTMPPEVEKIPLEDLIKEAVVKRPDIQQADTVVRADDVNVRASKNALLPVLTLSAEYASEGLAGSRAIAIPQIASGLPTAFWDSISGAYPELNAGLTLALPVRNRQAQGNYITSILDKRQDETRFRQINNNAAIDVHTAQILLEQARATVAAAVKTTDLDQQTLDAEQKKLQLGTSTLFNVVTDQNTLAAAAAAEVRAKVNLAEAKVNFDRAMGRTLEVHSITIANAKSGKVPKDTLIPGTSATGQLIVDSAKHPDAAAAPSADRSGGGSGQ